MGVEETALMVRRDDRDFERNVPISSSHCGERFDIVPQM